MAESNQGPKKEAKIKRDMSNCNTYNYSDFAYWDAWYSQEDSSFDWFQPYSSLCPFVCNYVPTSSRVLVVGCGNSVHSNRKKGYNDHTFGQCPRISFKPNFDCLGYGLQQTKLAMAEDMVIDGYKDVTKIDISSVVIGAMKRKYEHIPQLKYMQMDVRNMSFFPNESFDSIIDKGTLDSLLCGSDSLISSGQMLREVSRLLRPEGVYMLITYGDPKGRMLYLMEATYNWKITLYIIPSSDFQKRTGNGSSKSSYLEPVPTTSEGSLPSEFRLQDPESHFIYVCKKLGESKQSAVKHC